MRLPNGAWCCTSSKPAVCAAGLQPYVGLCLRGLCAMAAVKRRRLPLSLDRTTTPVAWTVPTNGKVAMPSAQRAEHIQLSAPGWNETASASVPYLPRIPNDKGHPEGWPERMTFVLRHRELNRRRESLLRKPFDNFMFARTVEDTVVVAQYTRKDARGAAAAHKFRTCLPLGQAHRRWLHVRMGRHADHPDASPARKARRVADRGPARATANSCAGWH